ncbi:hypothetical protein Tco_0338806, partial [Tanacetum coccineum]
VMPVVTEMINIRDRILELRSRRLAGWDGMGSRVGLVHPQSFLQVVYEQEQDVELGKLSRLTKWRDTGVLRDLNILKYLK